MRNDEDLLDRFSAVQAPVSRLTVESVLVAGRRRAARRRTVQAACGAALMAGALIGVPQLMPSAGGAPAGPGLAESCPVTRLPVPDAMTNVWAEAVDPTGRYIAGLSISGEMDTDAATGKVTGTAASRPILWTDGKAAVLPGPVRAVRPTAVNASGTVAAVAGSGKLFDSVLRYVGGVPEKATLPAGAWDIRPYARINAGGDILITAVPVGKRDPDGVLLLWKAGSAAATKLPLPAGADGKAITDTGEIIGDRLTAGNQPVSYVWDQHGRSRTLPAPAGQNGSVNAARGDWAIGNLWPSGSAVRWNLRTGEMLDLKLNAPAHAVNSRGWVVTDGALQRDGAAVALQPVEIGEARSAPMDIADNGTVVGSILGQAANKLDAASFGPLSWQCGSN